MLRPIKILFLCVLLAACSTNKTVHERYPFEGYAKPSTELLMPNYSIITPSLETSFKGIKWRRFSDVESKEGLTINVGLGNSYSYVVSIDLGRDIPKNEDILEFIQKSYNNLNFNKLSDNCVISDRRDDHKGRYRYYEYEAACRNTKNNKTYQIVISEKNILGREPEEQFKTMAQNVIFSFKSK